MRPQVYIVRAGELRAGIVSAAKRFLDLLPADKAFKLTVEQYRETRSEKQNKALWGLAYKILGDELGLDREELEALHETLLGEHFGTVEKKDALGRVRVIPKRGSSGLNTEEFAGFFDYVQRRAASFFCVFIPDPDPFWKETRARKKRAPAPEPTEAAS